VDQNSALTLQPGCISLAQSLTHSTLLTHNNSTKIHVHSRASLALHTNIKALLLGVIIVLDGMILHTTHGTGLLQHITITMAILNIIPATAVRRTQVTITWGIRLTGLTPPPRYGDLKPPTPGMSTNALYLAWDVSSWLTGIPLQLQHTWSATDGPCLSPWWSGWVGEPSREISGASGGVPSSADPAAGWRGSHLGRQTDVRKQTPQLTESYKAGMFIAALGARGIAPPNLHTKW